MGLNDEENAEIVYIAKHDEKYTQKLQPEKVEEKKDTWFLYFSALTANLLYLSGFMDMVWTSPVIPKLQSNDTNMNPLGRPITPYEISLLAGLPRVAGIIGTIAFVKFADILGRRKGLIYLGLSMLISNLLVAFSSNIYLYYVGRTLFSTFFGGVAITVPVYLFEIAEKHNRAKYVIFMSLSGPVGMLLTYLFGPILTVRTITILHVAPILPFLLFFIIIIPESPYFLASKGMRIESVNALKKLRSNKKQEEIIEDFLQLERELEARKHVSNKNSLWPFNTIALRRAFLIATVINLAHHCSGSSVIMAFLGPMFDEAHSSLSGNNIAILVGILEMISYSTTSFIVERTGRRILLLFSSAASGVPLFLLGLYFYLRNTNATFVESVRWLPIALISSFIIFYSFGLGSVTTVVIGELFPNDMKSIAFSYQGLSTNIVISIWILLYPLVAHYLGIHYCLWLFSLNCFIGLIGIYVLLPETKGRSILEIQKILSN